MPSFAGQWAIGAIIGLWQEAGGHYHPDGYRAGFGLLLLLQGGGGALVLYWWGGRREPSLQE